MPNLTPHWQQIQHINADAHEALRWIAKLIYEQQEEAVPICEQNADIIALALDLGYLKTTDGKVTFSDQDVRNHYLVRHIVDLALLDWDEPEKLISLFNEVYRCSLRLRECCEVGVDVLRVLACEHKKDVIDHVAKIAILTKATQEQRHSFRNLYEFFCKALPELAPEPTALADVLERILDVARGSGYIYSAIEEMAAQSQIKAEALYNEFIARLKSPVIDLAFTALLGLAQFNLAKAHNYALALTEADSCIHRGIGISVLGRFQYGDGEYSDLLHTTLEKLKYLRAVPNEQTDAILVCAYGNLLHQSNVALEAFVELASRQENAVRYQVAGILFRESAKFHSCSWYKDALFRLIQIPFTEVEALSTIDHCIEYYAKNEPELAIQIIESLAINWNYNAIEEENQLTDVLSSTFMELFNNQRDALCVGFTRWFASIDQRLHLAAWQVQRYCDSGSVFETDAETGAATSERARKTPILFLSKQVLDTLNNETLKHLLYRLSGYIVDFTSLASLLLSSLKRETNLPEINDLVTTLLCDYVLYNCPYEVGEYLQSRVESEVVTETERQVIQTALEKSNAYLSERQNLPRLKELYPPSNRLYLLQLAKSKQQTSLIEKAHQHSFFYKLGIVKDIPLKHGKAFSFMREDGSITKPSKLGTFSAGYEIPQKEWIDPLGQDYLRRLWRNIGLYNSNTNPQDETLTGNAP